MSGVLLNELAMALDEVVVSGVLLDELAFALDEAVTSGALLDELAHALDEPIVSRVFDLLLGAGATALDIVREYETNEATNLHYNGHNSNDIVFQNV